MSQPNNLQFPARLKPRLPGGSIHKMQINEDETRVLTWPNLYGNKESRCILAIPHSRIVEAEYIRPLLQAGEGKCRLRYLDESSQEQTLKFNVVDPSILNGNIYAQARQNEYTESVAQALEGFRRGGSNLPSLPALTLTPPKAGTKLLFGIGLVFGALLLTGSVVVDNILLWFFGTFLACMSAAALGIDHVRIHTGWHPAAKIVVYILIFLVAFIMFITAMALFETLNLI
jgi:hypothetical protein